LSAAVEQKGVLTSKHLRRKARRWGKGEVKKHIAFGTMLLPGFTFLFLFSYLPMPGIIMAFKKYHLDIPPPDFWIQNKFIYSVFVKNKWVGLDNFAFMFRTPDAWMITRNTVLYNLVFILLGLLLSVALAIAINELIQRRMAKLYQTIFFFPFFISWIVVSYLTFALFNTNYGMIDQILRVFGAENVSWYSTPGAWPFIFVFFNMWKYTGNGSIIYLATIAGLDQELYEAAAIDGASRWQQIRKITIPQLVPIMVLLTILAVGRIFNSDFDMFYSMVNNSGELRQVSTTIDVYVYKAIINNGQYGLSAAASLYQSVVGFVLILTTNMIVRRVQPDMALF
jgi:putative aldouronate transport system permease protein